VLLLLQLLDDRVIEMQRKSFERRSAARIKISLIRNVLAYAADCPDREHEGAGRNAQQQSGAPYKRVCQQFYQNSLQYQPRKRLPAKSATNAMLPRKTPNGIW